MFLTQFRLIAVSACLLAAAPASFAQGPTPLVTRPADKLIEVITSGTSQKEKADACRELSVVGGKEAVSALLALLPDEKLSHMARYALETMTDPGVNPALREQLGKLKGRPLVGVIGSLGIRRDEQAVQPLIPFLQDADADVVQAAARALGRIGTSMAADSLMAAFEGAAEANRLALCEGLARCAEALAAQGQTEHALAIYDHYNDAPLPHQARAAALRGAILTRGKDGLPLLREQLRSSDYILFAAAIRTALEMPGAEVVKALTEELGKLAADNQIVVIQALRQRADPAALPTLFAAAKQGAQPIRLAAIRALPAFGVASAVPVLLDLMADSEGEIARTARESLAALPGKEADAAVLKMLTSNDSGQRQSALDLLERRRMTGSLPAVLKATGDTDPQVRALALKKAGELGGPSQVPALVGLLAGARTSQDVEAAEQALITVLARAEQPQSYAENLTRALVPAQPAQKSALLRVLAAVGGADALKAVRGAIKDANADVRAAALRSLGDWKTAEAAPELLALAKDAANPTDKLLCLRGYLKWAADADLPVAQRLTMCQQAAGLIQQTDEKKLLLGALGSLNTPESVGLVAPYLDDAATREEACAATVAIVGKLPKPTLTAEVAAKLLEPLKKAAAGAANADTARRAKTLLEEAQKKADAK